MGLLAYYKCWSKLLREWDQKNGKVSFWLWSNKIRIYDTNIFASELMLSNYLMLPFGFNRSSSDTVSLGITCLYNGTNESKECNKIRSLN